MAPPPPSTRIGWPPTAPPPTRLGWPRQGAPHGGGGGEFRRHRFAPPLVRRSGLPFPAAKRRGGRLCGRPNAEEQHYSNQQGKGRSDLLCHHRATATLASCCVFHLLLLAGVGSGARAVAGRYCRRSFTATAADKRLGDAASGAQTGFPAAADGALGARVSSRSAGISLYVLAMNRLLGPVTITVIFQDPCQR